MFDLRNVFSLIIFRLRSFQASLKFDIRIFLAFISVIFASFFLILAFSVILGIDRRLFLGIAFLIPFLSQIILSQRGFSLNDTSENKDNTFLLFNFLKTLPISIHDKVLNSFFSEILFSFKFWFGITLSFLTWFLFCGFDIQILFYGLLLYGISFVTLNIITSAVFFLFIQKSKIIRAIGYILNVFINIFGVFIFFSLYSYIGSVSDTNVILKLLTAISSTNYTSITVLIFSILLLFLLIFLSYLQKYYANKILYFIDFEAASSKQKVLKPKNNSKESIYFTGIFSKNLKWILKFPGLIFGLLYPLLFIVLASKFLFPYLGLINSNGYRNLYLVLSLANFTLLSDNQISVYSKYFLFDLMYKIDIRKYFLSKFFLFLFSLNFIGILFFILNKYLELGFRLNLTVLLVFIFYFFVMQTKGVFLSLFDYRPMVYAEGTLKSPSPGFGSTCLVSLMNYGLLAIFYLFLMLNISPIFLLFLILLGAGGYFTLLYFSKTIFESKYYEMCEKLN